jgi:hypothetical protein
VSFERRARNFSGGKIPLPTARGEQRANNTGFKCRDWENSKCTRGPLTLRQANGHMCYLKPSKNPAINCIKPRNVSEARREWNDCKLWELGHTVLLYLHPERPRPQKISAHWRNKCQGRVRGRGQFPPFMNHVNSRRSLVGVYCISLRSKMGKTLRQD